jgi:predicted HicB family RNase H-like nuclease
MSQKSKQVNIEVPEELHRRAKVIAILKGMTLQEFLVNAIRKETESEDKVLEKLK